NTAVGGQAAISRAIAEKKDLKVGFEVSDEKAVEIITAFRREDLKQPCVMPTADYGVSVNTTDYQGDVVHFDGTAKQII
ncbi:MAG: hypothetical protein KKF44_05465, partial [Nanoarchaeota archaeon]|nr:hypothetical protein [Nanoarchaeota archaeon]